MITDLKHYPAMKPSGVERLGDVPEHWDVRRAKRVFSPRKELAREDDVQLSATQTYGVIPQDEYERRAGRRVVKISRHLDRRRHVEVDDFVISMRSFQGGLERAWARGCIRSSYIVIRAAGNVNVEFFGYLFKSEAYIQALRSTADFIRDGQDLNFDNFCAVDLPFPPTEEQAAIVRYLDHVDRRISRYIRAKRCLIDLLEEEKQAIIHRAVTRGLDLDVPLKPSGVEWLGDVPEHWNFESLGLIGSFFKGSGGTKDDEDEEGVPCVRYGDIYTQHQYFIRQARANIPEESAAKYTPIRYGDILFAGSGETIEEIGKSAVNLIDGPAYCGGDVIAFRPSIEADATFLGYAADSPTSVYQKACIGRGVTVMHIYSQELRRLLLPLPPLGEQRAIARYIDQATASIDASIGRARHEIELLGEYRTRLIADVVTGKLDVRETAAALPDVDPANLEDIIEIDDAVADELDAELEEIAT